MTYKGYEMVIGLEVHVELKTESKIFCNCKTDFGAEPNTQCCPVCMGMPGTLPVLNRQAVDYAIKAGIAANCTIAKVSKQDRKNYFYPDLPKAYQISQYDKPLCENGYLDIECESGSKRIGITRIHIEEDAGKLIHDENYGTMIDFNRCGVPLIEIVSEPDIRSPEEAKAYLQKLRTVMIYAGVSDCRMNEGSLRCDVNLSVRKIGETALGTRTEMKNLNSFRFIVRAIEFEFKRQVDEIESGGKIVQETRRFDENSGRTYSMRRKENADDYRYFPDPDLPIITVSEEHLRELKAQMPAMPDERKARYAEQYGLSAFDSEMIVSDRSTADYFEKAAAMTKYPKLLANFVTGEIFSLMGDSPEMLVSAENLAELADMTGENRINSSTAKRVLKEIWATDEQPEKIVREKNLFQINDAEEIEKIAREVAARNQKSVEDYKKGKKNAMKALVGQVMGQTGGRANPVTVNEIVLKILEQD